LIEEPQTYDQAIISDYKEEWEKPMNDESQSLKKNAS
jgi:hypothetical protein